MMKEVGDANVSLATTSLVAAVIDAVQSEFNVRIIRCSLTGSRPRFQNNSSDIDLGLLYVPVHMDAYFKVNSLEALPREIFRSKYQGSNVDVRIYETLSWVRSAMRTEPHTVEMCTTPVTYFNAEDVEYHFRAAFGTAHNVSALYHHYRRYYQRLMDSAAGAGTPLSLKVAANIVYYFLASIYTLLNRCYAPYNAHYLLEWFQQTQVPSHECAALRPAIAAMVDVAHELFPLRKSLSGSEPAPQHLVNDVTSWLQRDEVRKEVIAASVPLSGSQSMSYKMHGTNLADAFIRNALHNEHSTRCDWAPVVGGELKEVLPTISN